MLTTVDNPFNPWTEWKQWLAYDLTLDHSACAYLARIVISSDDLSEADQEEAIDSAIDEIISEDVEGLYKKVVEPSKSS